MPDRVTIYVAYQEADGSEGREMFTAHRPFAEVADFVQGDPSLQAFCDALAEEVGTMDAEGCDELRELGWSLADQESPYAAAAAVVAAGRLREYFRAQGFPS